MSGEPTILFGVGAAKAATSWLHDYLSGHPDCAFPAVKELHYFDAIETGRWGGQVKRVEGEIARLRGRRASVTGPRAAGIDARIADHQRWLDILKRRERDDAAYVGYLSGRGGRLVGDITPAYSMLSAASFAEMAAIAPDVRFVFLLRDPVSRLWSHVRMNAARQGADRVEDRARALMDEVLARPDSDESMSVLTRGDYSGTLLRLSSVVPPSNLFVAFMEVLITPEGVDALCDFLGIRRQEGRYDRRMREGVPLALDARRRAAAAELLRDQYEFVARLFPSLPTAWQHSLGQAAA